MNKKVVSLSNVSLSYNVQTGLFKRQIVNAVNNISFDLYKNEMLSIIGHNGSGKTTTLSIISGILKPDRGEIFVSGRVVPFLGLGIGFNPELTAKENVYLYGAVMGFSRKHIAKIYDEIVEFSELSDYMNLRIKEFSTGMYVRLGFSVAIYTRPDILIIDEVLAVGDVHFQRKCLETINKIKTEGTSILFVSHDMGLVSRFSDRVVLLDKGRQIMTGASEDVIEEYMNMKENNPVLNSNRRGSGEVEITAISINSEDRVFSEDDEISVKIEYKKNGSVEEGVLGFAVTDENGVLISGPNSRDYIDEYAEFHKTGFLEFSFKPKSLNPGKYYLTVALYDRTNRFPYDHIDFAEYFIIKGKKANHLGLIKFPVRWKVK